MARFFIYHPGQGGTFRQPFFTHVTDGAYSVSGINQGKQLTTSEFDVLVLRQDPCDVGLTIPEGAKYQTGPVYWLQEKYLPS